MRILRLIVVAVFVLSFGCKSAKQSVVITLEAHFQKVDGLEKPPVFKVQYQIEDGGKPVPVPQPAPAK